MLVSEILRVKGNATLFTAPPERSLLDAVKVMAENDIGSLIVMERGRMAGLLTFKEILQALDSEGGTVTGLSVRDIMVPEPLLTEPSMDVMELRRLMLEQHARYVPVVDRGTLLGVVSFHDVAKAVYEEASFENQMLKSYIER
jgi:CBS domain-containing protein